MGNRLARKGSGESRVAGWWRKWGVADGAEGRDERASLAAWTRGRQRLVGSRGALTFLLFLKCWGMHLSYTSNKGCCLIPSVFRVLCGTSLLGASFNLGGTNTPMITNGLGDFK